MFCRKSDPPMGLGRGLGMLRAAPDNRKRLWALLCLPYLLLTLSSPLLHTCTDSEFVAGSITRVSPSADPTGSGPSRVTASVASSEAHGEQCTACLWAKSVIGDTHIQITPALARAENSITVKTVAVRGSTPRSSIQPRAPPVG